MSVVMTHETINETYQVITIKQGGKTWEVRVVVDPSKDGGINVDITRDDVNCTGCDFGWTEKHCNEH